MDNRFHGQWQPDILAELFAESDESARGHSDNSHGHIFDNDLFVQDCGAQIEFAFPVGPTYDGHCQRITCPIVLRNKQAAERGLHSEDLEESSVDISAIHRIW